MTEVERTKNSDVQAAPLETTPLPVTKELARTKVDGVPELPVTVIEPAGRWGLSGFGELWRFRELLMFLAWRDIAIRYKQTVLGVGWAVAQPVATMLIFTFFLGRVSGVSAGIDNYPLFVFTAMIAWMFFINTVTLAGNSVIANERIITKIYFPRLLIPLATVGVSIFDLLIGSVLLAVMMLGFGVAPGWNILWTPLILFALGLGASGFGFLFAAPHRRATGLQIHPGLRHAIVAPGDPLHLHVGRGHGRERAAALAVEPRLWHGPGLSAGGPRRTDRVVCLRSVVGCRHADLCGKCRLFPSSRASVCGRDLMLLTKNVVGRANVFLKCRERRGAK